MPRTAGQRVLLVGHTRSRCRPGAQRPDEPRTGEPIVLEPGVIELEDHLGPPALDGTLSLEPVIPHQLHEQKPRNLPVV